MATNPTTFDPEDFTAETGLELTPEQAEYVQFVLDNYDDPVTVLNTMAAYIEHGLL